MAALVAPDSSNFLDNDLAHLVINTLFGKDDARAAHLSLLLWQRELLDLARQRGSGSLHRIRDSARLL